MALLRAARLGARALPLARGLASAPDAAKENLEVGRRPWGAPAIAPQPVGPREPSGRRRRRRRRLPAGC